MRRRRRLLLLLFLLFLLLFLAAFGLGRRGLGVGPRLGGQEPLQLLQVPHLEHPGKVARCDPELMDVVLIHQIKELLDEGQHPGLVPVQPGLLGQRGFELREVEAVVVVGVKALEEPLPLALRHPAPAGYGRFLRARAAGAVSSQEQAGCDGDTHGGTTEELARGRG